MRIHVPIVCSLFVFFLQTEGCGACEPERPVGTPDAAPASPSASRIPPPPVSLGPRSAALPCRVVTVDGDAQEEGDGGSALTVRSSIPQDGWLLLSAGARLVVKDPRTSRETTFRGPARARACVDLSEESWLASGTFESAVGSGETPGAEEWVATPLGLVRFGAAKLTLEVGARQVHIRVAAGPAFVWIAGDASGRNLDGGTATPTETDDGWLRIAAGSTTLTPASSPPKLAAARSALDACRSLAKAAHDLASALLETDAEPTTAMRQVSTRRLARAACAVAALRTDALSPSDAPDGITSLTASLKEAAALWRSLPLR
jgi:hypothetical protein